MSNKADEVKTKLSQKDKVLLANVIKGVIELVFEGSKATIQKSGLKIHIDSIDSGQIIALAELAKKEKVTIRRSGTGITIIVDLSKKVEDLPSQST